MNQIEFITPFVRDAKYGFAPNDGVLKERVIFDFEILYLKQGKLKVIVEGKEYTGEPGDIFFFRPNIKHSIQSISKMKVHQLYVHFGLFSSEERAFFRKDILQGDLFIPEHIRLNNSLPFENKLLDLIHEFDKKIPHYELQVKAKVTELLVYLWREFHWKKTNMDPNYETLLKVKEFLNDNFANKVTLNELVDIANISKYHLICLFKKTFGYTPMHYHQIVRIEKAKELIRHTNYSLSQIASELGFETIHSFSRSFKKIDGNPPSFYRKKV
ncbi:AraC family transcriptional regulator [Ammoniphilus sp. YIM 78166]|uniref:AraC family transcriptional regulator n=1 Tax=Ammoniphilus sp. YIM 78166 TaxID=1644106 RepID=UPI00106FB713|nr:AraC family transcriptional regulator [Ammoniphilus sp. YIM 78166]